MFKMSFFFLAHPVYVKYFNTTYIFHIGHLDGYARRHHNCAIGSQIKSRLPFYRATTNSHEPTVAGTKLCKHAIYNIGKNDFTTYFIKVNLYVTINR